VKRLPARAIGISGARIVNDLWPRGESERRAEVTVSEIHRRNVRSRYISAAVADPLIIPEEEGFVLNDWPTERESELVVNSVRFAGGKEIASGERADAVVFEDAALKGVAARSKGGIDHSPTRPPELRLMVAGCDIHGRERFDGWNQDLKQSGPMVVVDAFNLNIIGIARLAVDLRCKTVLRVEKFRVLPMCASRARD